MPTDFFVRLSAENLDKKLSVASHNYFCPSLDRGFDDPAKSSVHVEVYLARQNASDEIDKILDEISEKQQ